MGAWKFKLGCKFWIIGYAKMFSKIFCILLANLITKVLFMLEGTMWSLPEALMMVRRRLFKSLSPEEST